MDSISKVFLAEALDSWAVALAGKENCTWDELCTLIAYAGVFESEDPSPLRKAFCLKEQMALLALLKYLKLSKGRYQDRLIPFICQYLQRLLTFSWLTSGGGTARFSAVNNFTHAFCKRLFECSSLKRNSYEQISTAFSTYLATIASEIHNGSDVTPLTQVVAFHSLHGFLRALLDAQIDRSDLPLQFMIPAISELLRQDFKHLVDFQQSENKNFYFNMPFLDEATMHSFLGRALVRIVCQASGVIFSQLFEAWNNDEVLPVFGQLDTSTRKLIEPYAEEVWTKCRLWITKSGADFATEFKEDLFVAVVCAVCLHKIPDDFFQILRSAFERGCFAHGQIYMFSACQLLCPRNPGMSQETLMLLDDVETRHLWCSKDLSEKEKLLLRTCYSLTYVQALKNVEIKFDFSHALMRHVNILSALPIEKERQLMLQISLIEKLVELCKDEPMSEDLIPLLVGTLNEVHQKTHVARLLISALVDVSLATYCQDFVEILDAMGNVFKHIIVTDNSEQLIKEEIAKQFIRLSKSPDIPNEVREKMLERIMVMFIEQASWGQNPTHNDFVMVNNPVNVLTVLSVVAQIATDYAKSCAIGDKQELVALFRKVWAYCVLYGVEPSAGIWHDSWRPYMEALVKVTPCLTSGKSAKLSLSEVKADLANFSKAEESSAVNRSLKNLSEMPNVVVGGPVKMFLRTIFQVDKLLIELGNTPKIYGYLNELYDLDIRDELRKVARDILNSVLQNHNPQVITDIIRTLVLEFPTFRVKLFDFIFSHIEQLLRENQYVLRDPSIVHCVFDMLQILSKAADDDYLGRTTYSYKMVVNDTVYQIDIATGYEYRQDMFQRYRRFWERMYENAAKKSSSEVLTLMQNYIMTMRNFEDRVTGHAGFKLAIDIGISKHGCHDLNGILVNPLSFYSSQLSNTAKFFDLFSQRTFDTGSTKSLNRHFDSMAFTSSKSASGQLEGTVKQELRYLSSAASRKLTIENKKFYELFSRAASVLIQSDSLDAELLHLLCLVPVQHFTEPSLTAGVDAWTWLLCSRPDFRIQFMSVQVEVWEWCIRRSRGIFSQKYNVSNAFAKKMNYGASKMPKDLEPSFTYFLPHLIWIQFLASHYESNRGWNDDFTLQYLRLVQVTIFKRGRNSNHPLSRLCYFKLWRMFRKVIKDSYIQDWNRDLSLQSRIYELLLGSLAMPTSWNAYDDKYVAADIEVMLEIFRNVKEDLRDNAWTSEDFVNFSKSIDEHRTSEIHLCESKQGRLKTIQQISCTVLELELHRLFVWYNPLKDAKFDVFDDTEFRVRKKLSKKFCIALIKDAWNISPQLAVHLAQKGSLRGSREVLSEIISEHAFFCTPYPDAISYIINSHSIEQDLNALKYSIFWAPVSPITSISFFLPSYNYHPYLIQYGMRSLDNYPTELVFFYVPQIVQALRSDLLGYVESFIVSTAKISQLFAHQIIWNMNANMFKDEESTEPDSLKPVLDRIVDRIISSLDGSDKEFYEREFAFFEKVTGISGKLKPFIKRSKAEKKQKIDEELSQIQVDAGVYLPSNPESIVIDIDYKSGRPLQSHAKAPFMATFKIKRSAMQPMESKEKRQSSYESLYLRDDQNDDVKSEASNDDETLWQSAIFKVGDDCRQDVLALQLIAIFNNIYAHIGLDLYLFPYRIVATAPGCGIIEVVTNSVSRDQMGRSNINNLYEWFLASYGSETTIKFQQARDNFVKSLAAYSVILYLLQIKDRHNGNMLIDKDGHIVHIDFGFIFDIVPGGVKFELSPFKLTKEMIQILGGGPESLTYRTFVTYCVKAFLACRPYAENIVQMVRLMLDSGLPCFKGEKTIMRLRDRFQLELSEKLAAEYMIKLVNSSHEALSTVIYDGYQKLTNGIPF